MKNNMLCDLETGICGPAGENTSTMGFIDLSVPPKKVEPIKMEEKDIAITSDHSSENDTNARA